MFFVEYSKLQNCFHIDEMEAMISINRRAFLKDLPVDFIPIGVFETFDDAFDFCSEMELIRHKKIKAGRSRTSKKENQTSHRVRHTVDITEIPDIWDRGMD